MALVSGLSFVVSGEAVLLLGVDLLPSRPSLLGLLPASPVAASSPSLFFLLGLPSSDPTLPSSVQATDTAAAQPDLAPVATQLATVPLRSPDQRSLALVALTEELTGVGLSVSYLDTESGLSTSRGTLHLTAIPDDASLLITPTFAADSTTLCLVLSITVPTPAGTVLKPDPRTGGTLQLEGATWESHHALVYFDGSTSAFSGPFDLAGAPSLARVNITANINDLFLWTIDEPAAIFRVSGSAAPPPVTRLSVFPLGSGKPRLVTPAPGPWPVNGEPLVPASTGEIVRLAYGTELEIYSPVDGTATRMPIPQLGPLRAKPSAPSMEPRDDGTIFLAAPAIASAVVIDPAKGFGVVTSVSYPVPLHAYGGPSRKAVLARAGDLVYVLGDAHIGGLAAYETTTGRLEESYTGDQQYSGLQLLPSGNLVAVATQSPKLNFFSPALELIGSLDTDLDIAEIL